MSGVDRFRRLWQTLLPIGRTGEGYLRYSWSAADLALRQWFTGQSAARGLPVTSDPNGNLFAWWGDPAAEAVLTGSHFDSVPHGGAYDGPLGIASAFLAIDELRARGIRPRRTIGVVAFAEEEGARFGVPCLGSRLLTGVLPAQRALLLRDLDGVTLAAAMSAAGTDPAAAGPRPDQLARVRAFVELHIEQGRALADVDAPVGVGRGIWPHGRWRLEFTGTADHAGTTRMGDRRDPMLTFAFAVLAANKEARLRGAHATVGRVAVHPNATNAVPSQVTGWLDARAADAGTLEGLVAAVHGRVAERAVRDGTAVTVTEESITPAVEFDPALIDRCAHLLARHLPAAGPGHADGAPGGPRPRQAAPVLATAAGHDAGILAPHVPTVMLFVRNPTGVSHAPGEHATDTDCALGVLALTHVLAELACP